MKDILIINFTVVYNYKNYSMKILLLIFAFMFVTVPSSVYEFKLKTIDGKVFSLAQYKGKKVLVVNTASKCGFTPQYAELQKLANLYKDKLVIVGFPANNFGGQEPGANSEIKTFCQKNYGVTFQMFEKTVVKGPEKSPLYKWLTTKELNGWNEKEPTWNFCKYVINEKGELTHFFGSKIKPTDAEFLAAIK